MVQGDPAQVSSVTLMSSVVTSTFTGLVKLVSSPPPLWRGLNDFRLEGVNNALSDSHSAILLIIKETLDCK